jgi:orotidine-5'-phosphate decarboxylase
MNKSERLIVALDYPLTVDWKSSNKCVSEETIIRMVKAGVSWFKLRPRWFLQRGAFDFLKELTDMNANLMYDLKGWDTPDSVGGDVQYAFELGFKYVTVKAESDVIAGVVFVPHAADQHVLVVGNLTSQPLTANVAEGYLSNTPGYGMAVSGVVVPGCDLKRFRYKYPKAILVTPGIRMVGERSNDHEAEFGTIHPIDAIKDGATQIVVGRPITLAADPVAAAKRYLEAVSSV